jgi:hypothetical protein
MPNPGLAEHRRRQRARGLRRLELQIPEADAPLLRAVAAALSNPASAAETRRLLRERFTLAGAPSLKALLEAAPLDGVPLDRTPDPGRPIDL